MDFRDLAYNGLKVGIAATFYSLYNVRAFGNKNIPKPAILASNHFTYLDGFFIVAALREKDPIHFVTKPLGIYNHLYRLTGQIIIGNNPSYYREAEEALNKGRYLGFFCEGKRSLSGELERFHDGAASMAIRTQVPMIPICLHGVYDNGRKFPSPFRRVEVRFGNPINPPQTRSRINARELTQAVRDEIQRLAML